MPGEGCGYTREVCSEQTGCVDASRSSGTVWEPAAGSQSCSELPLITSLHTHTAKLEKLS